MAFIHSFESEGNWLFKHRGPLPVVLFILALPAIYITDYSSMTVRFICTMNVLAVAVCVLGFIIRAYTIGTTPKGTSGRNTQEQVAEQLNSTGIYSIVRHPLYLGNYLMWIGIVLFTKNIGFVIIVSLLFWIYYERIMFAEERFLERKFGDAYLNWSLKAPAFIPKFLQFKKSNLPFSLKSVLRREYSGVLATVIGFVYVELMINGIHYNEWRISRTSMYVLITTAVVVLILRTIKHSTHLLDEEGRS
jgi:protein-S-isoprenylcysteine O-methyltransferase Ste14